MKTKLFISSALFALMLCFSFQTKAQTGKVFTDSMLLFQAPLQLESGGKFILGDGGLGFILQPQSIMKVASAAYSKKVAIPKATKVSDRPIVLKNQKGCFEFSCGDACASCKLVWYDRNGDGKIQPRKELRCINAKGKVGKISLQKIPCQ